MNDESLFRVEALASRKNKNFGSVFINIPIYYPILIFGIFWLALFIIFFLIYGEFSEKHIVQGYLESASGTAPVFSNKNGIITKTYVNFGEEVKRGQALFLIDTTNDIAAAKLIIKKLKQKLIKINAEIAYKNKQLHTLKPLLIKKYISLETYNSKKDDLKALQQQKSVTEIEIINEQKSKYFIIYAPITGVIANINYHQGQYIQQNKPLAKILPKNSDLVAELFVPVSQIGFIKKNDPVIIRYDAYPFERFGFSKAKILNISKTILTDEEEYKPLQINKPYYKVIAQLDKQFVNLYGEKKKIRQGMTLSAVIVGAHRKIWQWIFDPIYSFHGNLVA